MRLVPSTDPILTKGLEEFDFEKVKEIFADAADLKEQMVDLMVKHKGIGLSACQVGLNMRCFVIGETRESAIMVINPKILGFSEETELAPEGCLSFPDMFLQITRPSQVSAEWLDEHGEKQSGTLDGYGARCFLHEFDHLNGVVFRNKVSRLKWERAQKKKSKITKQRNQVMQYMKILEQAEKNKAAVAQQEESVTLDLSTDKD
jgi:peptide deformylase